LRLLHYNKGIVLPEETDSNIADKDQEKDASNMIQLAVNKNGIIRGNFYNSVLDTTLPINGKVDKDTQRAAWTVGDKKDVVYEAGLKNLTQDQTPILVHFSSKKSEQMILVRLEEPDGRYHRRHLRSDERVQLPRRISQGRVGKPADNLRIP